MIDASWMRFSTEESVYNGAKSFFLENFETHKPCKYIYDNIVINPYSQMLACCGLTVEYNKYLKLGEIGKEILFRIYIIINFRICLNFGCMLMACRYL